MKSEAPFSAVFHLSATVAFFARGICAVVIRHLKREWQRSQFAVNGVWISRGVIINRQSKCILSIGQKSSVGTGTLLYVFSQGDEASSLIIGSKTAINEYNNIRACGGNIRIGDCCQIAQFCTLVASNHATETTQCMRDAPWSSSKVSIIVEDDVWIGANSVILPGVTIGRGAVIGAGAVVTRNVPPYSIYAGVPARLVRARKLHAVQVATDQ